MLQTMHIRANDKADLYVKLAAFAFDSFVECGVGCVMLRHGSLTRHPDGRIDAELEYRTYGTEDSDIPDEAVEMIDKYEPALEVIVVYQSRQEVTTCKKLGRRQIGCSPATAAMKGKGWHVTIEPGAVLSLGEFAGDADPGYYVFHREEKALMVLSRAALDDDEGRFEASEAEYRVHIDYAELFRKTGINVLYD